MTTSFDAKAFIKTLPDRPGVYRMLNQAGEVIYVGKARNLKKRVSSYFNGQHEDIKTAALVMQIAAIEIIITHSENEALILENTLIKEYLPRYNILFKDDKSYPYLMFTPHNFPALVSYRGEKKPGARYFGPYPTMNTARESLHLLQKLFKLRNCENSVFQHRSRPCLQYQIARCSAPCVNFISAEDYEKDIKRAELFLQGKNQKILDELIIEMQTAADTLAFEKAAALRDQIAILRRVQEQQYVHAGSADIDVIAALEEAGVVIVELLMIREGKIIGNKAYFPKLPVALPLAEVLREFISQHYLALQDSQLIPKQIIVSEMHEDFPALSEILSERAEHKVSLLHRVKAEKKQWLQLAFTNASHELKIYIANKTNITQRFTNLAEILGLTEPPQRIECFDISHTQGEATVASCVVFDLQGAVKTDYRRFNIEGIQPGDDYAAMRSALERRYTRIQKEEGKLPDLLIVDGGKGQLTQAREVLAELGITDILLLGIAKGITRKAGLEDIFLEDATQAIEMKADTPALHLLQQIRDEAHRFAITAHRQRRDKARHTSPLQTIPGVGPKRRRELLQHFGGLQELKRVSVAELAKVEGINLALAERIFAALHR